LIVFKIKRNKRDTSLTIIYDTANLSYLIQNKYINLEPVHRNKFLDSIFLGTDSFSWNKLFSRKTCCSSS